jgi:isoquinoline 1-oxidoreductase beta subunit
MAHPIQFPGTAGQGFTDNGDEAVAGPTEPASGTSRRGFLKGSGSAALVLGFALPLASGRAPAAVAQAGFAPNAYLRITPDNKVKVISGSVEMGQGVLTAVPMLLAEELDADWSTVSVEHAPTDPAYNNPIFGIQATGGSTTVRGHWLPLRKAGATARAMLVAAAAERWKLPPSALRTEKGFVIGPSNQRASYGSLAAAASSQPVPKDPPLKDSKDFKLLGQPLKRLDTPPKTNGSQKYGIDAHVKGMLVAVMARAPLPGAKPTRVDDSKAKAVKGVQQVITIDSGVAVLATGYWAAKKGRDALEIIWDNGPNASLNSAQVTSILAEGAEKAPSVAKEAGNVRDAAANSDSKVSAQYEAPYLAHACMEPMNCTAWVKPGEVEIWVSTQGQGPARGIVAQLTGVAPEKVTVNAMMIGGTFGRRFAHDFVIDATLLSKQSGKPVKLIYSREDDMAAGFYRPASVAKLEAVLDGQGRPTLLKVGAASSSIMAATGFMKIPASGVDSLAMEGIADQPYDIPNQRLTYGQREPAPRVWFWRSVGHSQNIFFVEGFIDELAAAAKQDPYEYRRGLLGKQPRYRAVLEAAAQRAGWGQPLPAGVFRGIAVAFSFGSYVAEVAEVSVAADGTPKVHRVVAAVDCGMTVNPAIIRNQIEGSIAMGLSAALHEKITFKDGQVEQSNFHNYPILRMAEMPKVEVHILPSSEAPGGVGEPGTPPLAPAVVNAIFAATGKRLRALPIDPAALRRA